MNPRFGADWEPSAPHVLARPLAEQLDQLAGLLADRRWTCLTGAGISTDSGIPDYRGPESPRATPMMYAEFAGSEAARRRYWARSFLGWQRMGRAEPNDGHRALAQLAGHGLIGIITQNVDGLHHVAGAAAELPIIDLHGRIADVICLQCGRLSSRAAHQRRLAALNPSIRVDADPGHAELRPDGDAVVEDWAGFRIAPCLICGGILKPDVTFFGESVPRDRVQSCYRMVDESDALVVAGSSLAVMSGLRFVRHDARRGKPVVIVNRGATRGDDLADLRIDAGTSEVLTGLLERLSARRSRP